MKEAVAADRAAYAQARWVSIALLVAGLIAALVAATWIIRSITGPLHSIRDVIGRVRSHDDFTQSAQVSGNDEVAQTAAAFNELLATLR